MFRKLKNLIYDVNWSGEGSPPSGDGEDGEKDEEKRDKKSKNKNYEKSRPKEQSFGELQKMTIEVPNPKENIEIEISEECDEIFDNFDLVKTNERTRMNLWLSRYIPPVFQNEKGEFNNLEIERPSKRGYMFNLKSLYILNLDKMNEIASSKEMEEKQQNYIKDSIYNYFYFEYFRKYEKSARKSRFSKLRDIRVSNLFYLPYSWVFLQEIQIEFGSKKMYYYDRNPPNDLYIPKNREELLKELRENEKEENEKRISSAYYQTEFDPFDNDEDDDDEVVVGSSSISDYPRMEIRPRYCRNLFLNLCNGEVFEIDCNVLESCIGITVIGVNECILFSSFDIIIVEMENEEYFVNERKQSTRKIVREKHQVQNVSKKGIDDEKGKISSVVYVDETKSMIILKSYEGPTCSMVYFYNLDDKKYTKILNFDSSVINVGEGQFLSSRITKINDKMTKNFLFSGDVNYHEVKIPKERKTKLISIDFSENRIARIISFECETKVFSLNDRFVFTYNAKLQRLSILDVRTGKEKVFKEFKYRSENNFKIVFMNNLDLLMSVGMTDNTEGRIVHMKRKNSKGFENTFASFPFWMGLEKKRIEENLSYWRESRIRVHNVAKNFSGFEIILVNGAFSVPNSLLYHKFFN